jgi:hypothetical protein
MVLSRGTIVNIFPHFLRPLIGYFVALNVTAHVTKCLRPCMPAIERRLEDTQRKKKNPEYEWNAPVNTQGKKFGIG